MTYDPRDLEVIVTSLEIAALELTGVAGATFSRATLFDKAREMIPELDEDDLVTTFKNMRYVFEYVEGGAWRIR